MKARFFQRLKNRTLPSFLLLFFISFFLQVSAKTVVIGTGSGNISETSMNGLIAGDILAIKPGTYSGATFSNLSGVSIINNGGLVTFTGGISISNLTNVTISGKGLAGLTYGFLFKNANTPFAIRGKCSGLRIYNVDNNATKGDFIDASGYVTTYNGTVASKLLYKTAIANIRLTGSGGLLMGAFAATTSFQNVIDSIAVFNIIISNTITNGNQILGNSIYHLYAHDWTVTGQTPNGATDVGIIQICGNARVHSINRNGGYGYIMRIWNVGLDGVSDSYLYNCIDLNSWMYGTIDTRVDPTMLTGGTKPPFATGGNIHILNNTTGNKTESNGYTTVLAIIGNFTGYKCEVRNNVSFNNHIYQSNPIFQLNNTSPLTDTSNNLAFTTAEIGSVLVDDVNCYLKSGSPAINKGCAEAFIIADIGGVSRPQGGIIDIGAREYNGTQQAAATVTSLVATPSVSSTTLQWQTATETSSTQFVIQRSTDGSNWNAIDSVAAAGKSVAPTNYSYKYNYKKP